MKNQRGQVVLILILVMTVGLAIGIAVIQRSLSDISTSSKVEQSSRAYSAAEAGIEKAIQADTGISYTPLDNNSAIQGVEKNNVPNALGPALEYPPLAKEELAQVWLVSPNDLTSEQYDRPTLDIYWGNPGAAADDNPAIEISLIYQVANGEYKSARYFFDLEGRNEFVKTGIEPSPPAISTSLAPSPQTKSFLYKRQIDVSTLGKLFLLRARLLYNKSSQAFAVAPASGFSLPVQARLFTSTGVSGNTQRKVQVLRINKVVPHYFDYAIFSAGEINK